MRVGDHRIIFNSIFSKRALSISPEKSL